MKNKLALILSGGGMTCSWGVGVIDALVKEYGLTDPDLVIAGSGSAGTMTYYVSGQYGSIVNIWSNLLATKKFIDIFRIKKIIDIDYLIDEVFKKQDRLNVDKFMESKIQYLIPATNCVTGEIEYFEKHKNIFEEMRATKAMPLVYGKEVKLNGKKYCDSRLSSTAETHINKAIELGATHIIVIDSNTSNWVTSIGFNLWLTFRNKIFRKNYSELKKEVAERKSPWDVNILWIKPKNKLEITTLNNDRELLKKTNAIGYKDCKDNAELKVFLDGMIKKAKPEPVYV